MSVQDSSTLDKKFVSDFKPFEPSKVVKTLLKMMEDYAPIKSVKDQKLDRVKSLYLKAVNGQEPNRMDQFPSFLLPEILESWMLLVQVPDVRLKAFGTDPAVLSIMTKYLEKKVHDGGFNKMMETEFGGYRQGGLYGDFWVLCGVKTKGDVGMPEYRGVNSGALYFNNTASTLRRNTGADKAYKFAMVFDFDWQSLDTYFPGMQKNVTPGDLPSVNQLERSGSEMTDQQRHSADQDYVTQVALMFDVRDEKTPVYSVIAGQNAYEWKTLKGEKYPHFMKIDGEDVPVLPLAQFGMYPYPEGIYNAGIGEIFYKLSKSEGDINTSFVNNTLDNNYATGIVNIDNASAEDIFNQLAIAGELKRKGENSFIVPNLSEDDKAAGKTLGKQSVDYIKNDAFAQDNSVLVEKFEQVVRRMGFNLDINFTDPDKTLGQTELDIESANKTVSKIQAQNLDFYEFIYQFAVQAIIKNGDENNDKLFGDDIKLEIDGKQMSVGEVQGMEGQEEATPLTEGEIIKLFKAKSDTLELEIDLKNGVKHNKLLERRGLERRLNLSAPGSPQQLKLMKKMNELEGDIQINDEEFFGQPQEEGGQPTAPSTQGQLATQLIQ